MHNIDQTVKDFILAEFLPGEDPSQLTDATPLVTSGILDSIATMKLATFLEVTSRSSWRPTSCRISLGRRFGTVCGRWPSYLPVCYTW
jgi:aryl carrier-like protein